MIAVLLYAFITGTMLFAVKGETWDESWPATIFIFFFCYLVGRIVVPLDWYADFSEMKVQLRKIEDEARKH